MQADRSSSEPGNTPASAEADKLTWPGAASPATATDFGALPPEITTGRMHSGPGAESLLGAAMAWDEVADQLDNTVAGYEGVATQTFAPYTVWLKETAAQARRTGQLAEAAAGAHAAALAAVVSPQQIEANRQQRMSLAAMNCLGHTSAAIAGVEADYERMWAQNADAMFAYARSSAEVSTLTPFRSPPHFTDSIGPTGSSRFSLLTTAPDVISTGRQLMSVIPGALRAICASPMTTCDVSLSPVTASLSKLSSLSAPGDFVLNYLNCLNKTAAVNKAAAMWPQRSRAGRGAPRTGFGHAVTVGPLSVPPAWVQAQPTWADPQAGLA
ncbi:PPE family protein [Mycobacterium stomatepiae]|uniref:Putative PPE family protein PPE32 n=1 Tax=Mycobacterium stomatepiae TaxID=470076 RepID=A0A7I7Q9C4_9MYCO|nr:PPE family protein [Mycobacterium stomatepiae]MCV7164475.1 PPE family protein [Mycobacterium stomatepiae]BBY22893.1 putative PPE family protein PPE32 [Mycobacterium stomatepiae]